MAQRHCRRCQEALSAVEGKLVEMQDQSERQSRLLEMVTRRLQVLEESQPQPYCSLVDDATFRAFNLPRSAFR